MKKNAFTLIELSIVLVIIGLIVGGVLVGRDLIRAAELRSIVTDWNKYETATRTFKLKYDCIPGDCTNAAQFGLGTSGNGNGYTEHSTSSIETWQFWTHLGAASMIEGTYTGDHTTTNTLNGNPDDDATIGVNVPGSRISGVGYSIWYPKPIFSPSMTALGQPVGDLTHYIVTGKDTSTGNYTTLGAGINVLDSLSLDTKTDDGQASTGIVRTQSNNAAHDITCTTGTEPDYSYDTSGNGNCTLLRLFTP